MATRYVNTASSTGGNGTTNATSGADRAYVSLSEWEAARQAVLSEVELCYCEGSAVDSTQCTIDGWTTSAANYIDIRGNNTTNGRHAGVYSTSKYRLAVSAVFNDTMRILEDYVRITGIQAANPSTDADAYSCINIVSGATSNIILDSVLVYQNASTGVTDREGAAFAVTSECDVTFRNCIAYSCRYGIWTAQGFAGTPTTKIDNCTLIASVYGIMKNDDEVVTVRNTYCHGTTDAYSGTMTRTTCAHSSGTSFSGSTASVAHSTANFTNVTGGSQDYHLVSGSALLNVGTDLSGDFTGDIDEQTRPTGASTWDIGADELISGGGPFDGLRLFANGTFLCAQFIEATSFIRQYANNTFQSQDFIEVTGGLEAMRMFANGQVQVKKMVEE